MLGHNGGPVLSDIWQPSDNKDLAYKKFLWGKAVKKFWKSPDLMIVKLRVKRAKELGISYNEHVLRMKGKHVRQLNLIERQDRRSKT